MLFHIRRIALCLMLVATAAGCAEEAPEAKRPKSKPKPAAPAVTKVARDTAEEAKRHETQESTPEGGDEQDSSVTFAPPFPNRVELFVPPGRPKQIKRASDAGGDQLKFNGFAWTEGGPIRAALVVDGVLIHLGVGESHGSLEVVAISEQSVTLQRGRTRWTESVGPARDDED